jgi:hypothetical protein
MANVKKTQIGRAARIMILNLRTAPWRQANRAQVMPAKYIPYTVEDSKGNGLRKRRAFA